MNRPFMRHGLALAALAVAATLAGCASNQAEVEAEAARVAAEAAALARIPPPISLNDGVAQSAAVYLAFSRDMAALRGGFADAESIQAALRRGSAYDPARISQGLIAYASILALQSPEFVAGVRQYAGDPATRQKLVADIVANPAYASILPGADAAAGLIIATLDAEIDALGRAADSIESDAYTIQERGDPRRAWAVAHITDRVTRLEAAKAGASQTMLPSPEESARLLAAGTSGAGLVVSTGRPRTGPYPPAVTNALAIAALAALGAAGEPARANIEALQAEQKSESCLNASKLNLYQCLAASRPSYEDMFCVGRHVVRDLATCARGSAMPGAIITVSNPETVREPAIVTAPLDPPVRSPAPTIMPPATPLNSSPTSRLNSGVGQPTQSPAPD
ncbi:hypothetical protein [Brevundimonas sp.]|uniref:hypothetical protein n=1 Tax=Brevundimonas sp. TaxID=1871086 RepID=UPI0035630C18